MSVNFGYDIPECPSGNIVGGTINRSGRCFYAGKPQGQKIYAETGYQVEKGLRYKINQLKKLVPTGYPDDAKWEMRIYE